MHYDPFSFQSRVQLHYLLRDTCCCICAILFCSCFMVWSALLLLSSWSCKVKRNISHEVFNPQIIQCISNFDWIRILLFDSSILIFDSIKLSALHHVDAYVQETNFKGILISYWWCSWNVALEENYAETK